MKNSLRAFPSAVPSCAVLVSAVLLGAFFAINWAPNAFAQATNPSSTNPASTNPAYIEEFPPVDKVMAAEKVADPDQTAAQQMAAFTQLMNMILQTAGPRQFMSGPKGMTQDEQNLRQAYNTALYNIQKSNPKYANPLAMKSLDFSQTFRNQMIQQLFPPNFQAEFTKAVAAANQQQAAIHQQALAQLQQQVQQQQQDANMDPATREMRRCVSSGRVAAVCTGNALSSSLLGGVNGLLSSLAPGTVGKEVTGPQMAGVFGGAGGWRLEFSEASVALSCQDMSPDSHAYTISFVNNRAVLDIAAMPKDVMLTVTGDTLSGTGPVTVQGRIYDGASDKTTAPMNMTCNLAMLTTGPIPKSAPPQPGAPAVSPLLAGPASAPAAPVAPLGPDPFAALSSVVIPTAAGGSASLSIYNSLTGAPSPLAGKRFVLLRDDLNNVIAKSGAAMPPGASPVTTMSNDCAKSTPDCQKILTAVKAASVASMVASSSGMPRLFVAPGAYYVVVSAPVSNKMLYWDVKVNLQDGNNSVTLTPQNAAQ